MRKDLSLPWSNHVLPSRLSGKSLANRAVKMVKMTYSRFPIWSETIATMGEGVDNLLGFLALKYKSINLSLSLSFLLISIESNVFLSDLKFQCPTLLERTQLSIYKGSWCWTLIPDCSGWHVSKVQPRACKVQVVKWEILVRLLLSREARCLTLGTVVAGP